MEEKKCSELKGLAEAAADLISLEASDIKYFLELSRKSEHGLGTAAPRPVFSYPLLKETVDIMRRNNFMESGALSVSGLLSGDMSNLDYADSLLMEMRKEPLGKQREEDNAMRAAEALESAAEAFRRVAAASYIHCAKGRE